MNNFLYSEGSMKTTVNNEVIDDNSYKFEYDGNIGKGVVQNNKDSYYVELDDGDFEKIFKKNHDGNTQNIEHKLKDLLNDNKSPKNKTRKKSMKPSIKSKSFQERNDSPITKSPKKSKRKSTQKNRKSTQKNRKSKRKSLKKTNRKSKRSIKKTNKMPLETNFLKTLI
jgi:hypothetical protein